MPDRIPPKFGRLGWPLVTGIAYLAAAYFSFHVAQRLGGVATIWPAGGIFVAALLLGGRTRRIPTIIAVACAGCLADYLAGLPILPSLGYTLANLAEGVLAAALFCRGNKGDFSFGDPAIVARFCGASLIACATGALLSMALTGSWIWPFFLSWFATVFLGQLIVAPLVITVAHGLREPGEHLRMPGLLAGGAIMALLLMASVLVFSQNRYPLLFLPPAIVVLATYRLGTMGAAASVLLVALVGLMAMADGTGPIHFIAGNAAERIFFFQFFLLVVFATALPLAALLAQRERMLSSISRGNALLEMSERAAQVGHWRVDLSDNSLFWSAEVFRIHGRKQAEPPSLESAIEVYHDDDRQIVEDAIARSLESGEEFFFLARLIRPDGTVRHVESRGRPEFDEHGNQVALFGVFQDVTERIDTMLQLEQACSQAEEDAMAARILAETDQLTGIANRRKIMAEFSDEYAHAKRTGEELSVAILDVDHFKSINDTYGHGFGDVVLQAIAESCQASLRKSDHVGRLGGEEFMLTFPGSPVEGAERIAERLRANIEALRWKEVKGFGVTVSIGLASLHEGESETAMLTAADKALYAAKEGGRNCLKIAA